MYAALKLHAVAVAADFAADEHQRRIHDYLARIIAGDTDCAPRWLTEEHFLELEQRFFGELLATKETEALLRAITR